MLHRITVGATLLSFAYWLFSRTFKRGRKARILPIEKQLTVREPDELSVLCYNVLADNVVRENPSFNYANELYRSWEYRVDKLRDQITVMSADVVCLQEVEVKRWQEWKRFMDDLGYTGVLLKRQNPRQKSGKHRSFTNATFFRSRRFAVCWEHHCNRALGVGLQWISASGDEHRIFVANVHLEGHPYKPAERVHQVNTILKALETEQYNSGEELDVVFCGDFNSARCNAPWQYLYGGRLEAGYNEPFYPDIEVVRDTVAHPFALVDTYRVANAIPEFTARAPRRRTEVDFIFASRHLNVAAVLRAVDPRYTSTIDRTLLPNRNYPSDHLPLGVVLVQPTSSEKETQRSILSRVSADVDSVCYEIASGSCCSSDHTNNADCRPESGAESVEGGVKFRCAVRQTSRRFLDDTALA